jgi:Fibronectin type III domain
MRVRSVQGLGQTWPCRPWRGAVLHSTVLIGIYMLLALHGCVTTSLDTQAPGAPVDPVGQIRLSWKAPTTRADGTPSADIAGFRLHYGLMSGTYAFMKTVGAQTTVAVSGLEPGRTYYFAVTAHDSAGNESRLSDEVTITVPVSISETPMVIMDPLIRGQIARFRVAGANPQEIVSFLYSTGGEGAGPCSTQLGGLCVDVIAPQVFGEAMADSTGLATLTHFIPADAPPGQTIAIQAVIQRGPSGTASVKTNAITARVLDQ